MRRTTDVTQVIVVIGMLIGIADYKPDRRTGSFPFEDSGKYLHTIFLITGGNNSTLARATTVDLMLNAPEINFHTGWHTVNDSAKRGAMGFSELSQAEECSKSIHEGKKAISATTAPT